MTRPTTPSDRPPPPEADGHVGVVRSLSRAQLRRARTHSAGHSAVALGLGRPGASGDCPEPGQGPTWQPDIAEFRGDLAVLLGGLAADLLLGRGRATPAGAADLLLAIQRSFDMFVRGAHWPELEASRDLVAGPLVGVVAEVVVLRAIAETERAVSTATRILLTSPRVVHGPDRGA